MAWVGAAISALAGGLGSMGGSSGGGGSFRLPRYMQGTIRDFRDATNDLYGDPSMWPQYPDAPPISPINPWEMAAIGGYGSLGARAGELGDAFTGSLFSGMMNNPAAPYAAGFGNAPNMWNTVAGAGPSTVGPNVADPNLGLYGSTAGIGADPNAAINEMLSGQVDNRFQDALDASFAVQNRNFSERLLPQLGVLDDQYTGGQGGAGGLKVAQRALEDLSQQQTEMSTQAGYSAYIDALNRRDTGANLATQARLTQSGQNLTGAGLGQQLGRFNAGQGLTADIANQGAYFDWLNSLGQGAQIGAGAAYNAAAVDQGYLSQIPNAYNLYAGAPNAWGSAGQLMRGLTDPLYANEFARQQYTNSLPFMMNTQYGNQIGNMVNWATPGVSPASANPWIQFGAGALDAWANYQPPPMMNTDPTLINQNTGQPLQGPPLPGFQRPPEG